MDCKTAKRLIPALIDGEVRPDKAAMLTEHLGSCHSCREEMASLKRTMEVIGVCADIEPSFTLADVRERAEQRQYRNPVFAWLQQIPRLATAATMLAALAMGSVCGVYYGSHISSRTTSSAVTSTQHVSDSLGLDAFDDGILDAIYVADAEAGTSSEVTR